MTDKTFTFTIEQIKDIYRAGIRRGSDEQSAHDWGCHPSGKQYDECIDAVYDIVNEGKDFWAFNRTTYEEVKDWFKETK